MDTINPEECLFDSRTPLELMLKYSPCA